MTEHQAYIESDLKVLEQRVSQTEGERLRDTIGHEVTFSENCLRSNFCI